MLSLAILASTNWKTLQYRTENNQNQNKNHKSKSREQDLCLDAFCFVLECSYQAVALQDSRKKIENGALKAK